MLGRCSLQQALAAQLIVGQVHGTLHFGEHPLLLSFGDAPKTHSCDRMRAMSGSSHTHSHASLPSFLLKGKTLKAWGSTSKLKLAGPRLLRRFSK